MNVYEKLQRVQLGLKAPKSQYNKFGNYYYRNCEDIQEAAKPLLEDVKAVLVVGDELIMVGDRYYIKATAKFVDCESSESVDNTAYAREEQEKKGMDASQITGSASSYARKYALNGLFCIDDTKDTDSLEEPEKPTESKKSKGKTTDCVTETHINTLFLELARTGIGRKNMLSKYGLKDIHDMTMKQFREAMDILKSKPDKPTAPDPATVPPDDPEEGLPWNEAGR